MNDNEAPNMKQEEISELKFYIPEDLSASIETERIIKLLLTQFKDGKLLDAIDGIQRYRNVIELTVFAEYKQKFLTTPITWSRCSSYLVTENEPIIIINIYAARLTSRWTDLVNKFNEFGKVVIYYDLKENYDGHEIKTGVRSIWLKDVVKRPKELTQGNRKLRVVYDKDIMNKLLSMNDTNSEKSKDSHHTIRDEIDAKFAELLKSGIEDKETKDSEFNKENELLEDFVMDNNSADAQGILRELKGQLETIIDHDEPSETVAKVGVEKIKERAPKPYFTCESDSLLELQQEKEQTPKLQHSQQQHPPLQPPQQKQQLQQQQQLVSRNVNTWRNETSM